MEKDNTTIKNNVPIALVDIQESGFSEKLQVENGNGSCQGR